MRNRAVALIASIALHAAVLAALVWLRTTPEPGFSADMRIVELALIPSFVERAEPALPQGEEVADDPAPSEAEDAPSETDIPPAESESRLAEAVTASRPTTTQAVEAELGDASPQAASVPPATEPASRPQEAPLTETPPAPSAEPLIAEAGIDARANVARAVETPAVDETAAPTAVARRPMAAMESQTLERRVAAWSRSFASLGDWQPSTTWTADGLDYTATMVRIPAPDAMGIEEAIVTVSAEQNGETVTTELRMQRLGFSHYAQFVDRWDPDVQIHNDEIDGRFHSNSEIYVSHSNGVQPTFLGKVTTASEVNTSRSDRRVRREDVFLGGLETHVGRIVLPQRIELFADGLDADTQEIHRFASDTRIEFHADGTFTWHAIAAPQDRHREALGNAPVYLLGGENAELHVSGSVNGKVLVFSPRDVVIVGNLVYARNPAEDADSDDYLGLVSEQSVDIAPADVTGPGDLSVHAAIYARRRFTVRNYIVRDSGTLSVYGSITAGSVSATEPRFRTQLRFDRRLERARPPGFPVTDRFEIAEWDAAWRVDALPN